MQTSLERATAGVAPHAGDSDQRAADAAALGAWIERLSERIVRRGLETPAILFLEMHKPLCFFASQGVLFAMPLLGAFLEPREVEQLARLLDSQDNVDRLIARIDDLAAAREKGPS